MRSYAAEVTYLLDEGLPVMVYSGLEDLICNSLSQEWCETAPRLNVCAHLRFTSLHSYPCKGRLRS